MDEINFRVGDLVVVEPWNQRDYITKIAHVTPKGYVQLEGYVGKFHAKYNNRGEQIPYSMTGGHIRPATEEDIERIAHRNRMDKLAKIDWHKVDPEFGDKVYAVIKEYDNALLGKPKETKQISAPKD